MTKELDLTAIFGTDNPLAIEKALRNEQQNFQESHKGNGENWININDVAGFSLYQTYFAWKRKIDNALLPHDLTHVQFILLMSLGYLARENEQVTQNELSKFTCFDVTMTSQVLRALEKRGFVERVKKTGDERSKFPKLTKKGVIKTQAACMDFLKAETDFFE